MGRGHRPQMRSLLATLCVALSVVFAATSVASVVDRIQHAVQMPHEHASELTLIAVDDDHHHAADHPKQDDRDDADQAPGDHAAGPGHHHADAPTGSLNGTSETSAAVSVGAASPVTLGPAGAKGIRPGGLERPPKPIAIRV